jgi:FlaA1/EpsC-like NDP-sugar epimerase
MTSNNSLKVIMLGATGAVGGEVLKTILTFSNLEKVTLLGRRTIPNVNLG